MNTYQLTTKSGEKFKEVKANTFEEAIEMFSQIKNLNKKELLKIYTVTKK